VLLSASLGRVQSSSPAGVQISDQTFIAAERSLVAAIVADPRRWHLWWPDLTLELTRDRGLKGCQWVVRGPVGGTAEVYLEAWQDGTVLNLFLRLSGPDEAGRHRGGAAQARTLAWKRSVTRLKDEMEAGRLPGTAAIARSVPISDVASASPDSSPPG
jgi:hypothetical protein